MHKNDTAAGETNDSYSDALNWLCGLFTRKTLFLKNTHGTNDLKYKILTFAYKGGIEYVEVSETTLAAGDVAQVVLNYSYAQIKVQVKDSVSGTHATYRIDYTGVCG